MVDIKQLKNGSGVEGHFGLVQVEKKDAVNGKPYIMGKLQNATGRIDFKRWDTASIDDIINEKVVFVKGVCQDYKGNIQVIVKDIRPKMGEVAAEEIIPGIPEEERREYYSSILARAGELKSLPLQKVTESVLIKYAEKALISPAAWSIHHAKIGGWVQHVNDILTVAKGVARKINRRFQRDGGNFLNEDLVMAGVIWHDMGKLKEMSLDYVIGHTTEGELLSHIPIGHEMLVIEAEKYSLNDNPEILLLKHIILSHHKRIDWGSPVQPKIPEAMIVHQLDALDASMEVYLQAKRENTTEWSKYEKNWEGKILLLRSDVYPDQREVGDTSDKD